MHVLQWPNGGESDESYELDLNYRSADLHGHIGALDDIEPDESRPRIGFRMRTELVSGFPRGPALSWDGKTWTPL